MPALRYSLIIAAAALCGPTTAQADGVLDKVRSEVNEPSQEGGSSDHGSGGSSWDDDDDGEEPFAELAVWVTFQVVISPFTLPIAILDDDYEKTAVIPDAPYLAGSTGYLTFEETPEVHREWGGRISVDGGSNFDGLSTFSGRVQLENQNRWGVDATSTYLTEARGRGRDHLTVGDANLVYRFAQSETTQFYTGIGINWLVDHGDFDAGFNFTYGADWFPVEPIVVSTTMDLGGLGGASLFRSRTTVGALIDRLEVYSGFDYLNVEGVDIPTGIAGLRLWY